MVRTHVKAIREGGGGDEQYPCMLTLRRTKRGCDQEFEAIRERWNWDLRYLAAADLNEHLFTHRLSLRSVELRLSVNEDRKVYFENLAGGIVEATGTGVVHT